MIQLLPAKKKDLKILREMAIQTQVDTFAAFNTPQNMEAYLREAYSIEQLAKELTEQGSIFQIAWDDEEAVGFSRLRLNDEVVAHLGTNHIELQRLYVRGKFQGKKVGAALMKSAIDFAKSRRYEWIWLGVWERNFKAQEFYRKWGFVRFSEHVFRLGDDLQTDWLLKLKL